jgi:hypothetical protein
MNTTAEAGTVNPQSTTPGASTLTITPTMAGRNLMFGFEKA